MPGVTYYISTVTPPKWLNTRETTILCCSKDATITLHGDSAETYQTSRVRDRCCAAEKQGARQAARPLCKEGEAQHETTAAGRERDRSAPAPPALLPASTLGCSVGLPSWGLLRSPGTCLGALAPVWASWVPGVCQRTATPPRNFWGILAQAWPSCVGVCDHMVKKRVREAHGSMRRSQTSIPS